MYAKTQSNNSNNNNQEIEKDKKRKEKDKHLFGADEQLRSSSRSKIYR